MKNKKKADSDFYPAEKQDWDDETLYQTVKKLSKISDIIFIKKIILTNKNI